MTAPGDAAVTFGNPRHDFPQRVVHRLHPGGRPVARIEGNRGGTLRGTGFPMRRMSGEPPAAGRG